jgi:hypothetical protein
MSGEKMVEILETLNRITKFMKREKRITKKGASRT